MRYNNARLKLSHISIFSTENEYKNQKTEYEVYQFLDKYFSPYKLCKYWT